MDVVAATILIVSLAITTVYVRRRVGGRITLSLLFFGSLLLIHGVPMLVYVFGTGPDTLIYEAALDGVDRIATLSMVMYAVALMFVCLIVGSELGMLAAPRLHRLSNRSLVRQGNGPLHHIIRIAPVQRLALWLLVAGMLGVSIAQAHASQILNFFTFDGSDIEKTLLRAEKGGSPFYLYNVVLYSIAPFLVMVSWADDVRRHLGLRRPSPLTIALFSVTLLGKFGTLSKAPPVVFVLQLLLMAALLRGARLDLRLLSKFVVAAVVLFATIVRLTFPDLDLGAVLAFLYYRAFDIPNEALLEYFAAIPASIPHTWGASVFSWLGHPRPDTLETYYAVAEVTRGSLLSTSNAMFIGDAWAQFSWFGVTTVSVLAAFIVRLIDLHSHRAGRSDLSACVTAGCAFGIFTGLSTAFSTALVTGGLITLPVISAWFITHKSRRGRGCPGDASPALQSSVDSQ